MPRESLDTPEDRPKEALGQVALGQIEDEVPNICTTRATIKAAFEYQPT